ncbi:hypothetical protein DXG03_001825 [Asterophora parasitica]|uniref:Uncharacterized protein n=1 Tax=Asterophora parasitica TaxID=117018 RepID=A0A9P7G2Q9_9AGAR|nr:hypothetical protein DXG03_001825 [Asterophora parasitica]
MEVPPTYTAAASQVPDYPNGSNDPPPTYAFIQKFKIGQQRTPAPLVTIQQLKGHLSLLHAFATLRDEIETLDTALYYNHGIIPFIPGDKERRWGWFVGRAVERFSLWCGSLPYGATDKPAIDFLPPLDVLMVWHAYMLNPGWYYEDCLRVSALQYLLVVTPIFSSVLSSPDLEALLTGEPTKARVDSWTTRTGKPFDPLEDARLHQARDIRCPKCWNLIEIPYMNTEGTGYLQQAFSVRCPKPECKDVPNITKAVLGVRKIAEDLAREQQISKWKGYLAGTLRTAYSGADAARAKLVKDSVLMHSTLKARNKDGQTEAKVGDIPEEEWVMSILERSKYDIENVKYAMGAKMKGGGGNLLKRILSAYTDGEIFSVDLAGAVLRQGSFVKKMHDLHWTEPHFFDSQEDEVALQHSIARYHAFLDLMAASPVTFYVPTLDIDLAWHTHQLLGNTYNVDCGKYIGRFIDHDDKVEEDALATAFDITCRAWKDRFNIPYTHCGCPLPGQTVGQRLSRLVANYKKSDPSYLVPPAGREDLRAATHPSDHNAVFVLHHKQKGQAAQERRRAKFRKRQERELAERASTKSKGKGQEMTAEERRRADERHDAAFLMPVPLFWYGPGYGGAGCAAPAGHVVYSANGTGTGGCAAAGFHVTFWLIFLSSCHSFYI